MHNDNDDPCPNCGYCRHCGRSNTQPIPAVYPWPATLPYYPYQPTVPVYPYPWWGIYPPNTTGPFTIGNDITANVTTVVGSSGRFS